jgi:UDPglucose--hexose-1-phosphate uridylyltransferase
MAEYSFLKNSGGKWVILAPKRSKRPAQSGGGEPPCPFEFIDGKVGDSEPIFNINQVRVISNLYPFAPIHEIIIHSDDHRKSFGELDYSLIEDIFKTFKIRFELHRKSGQVYIFHNHGKASGESLPHPHTQLTVIPFGVELEIPQLRFLYDDDFKALTEYIVFCPQNSSWPDEVWVAPKRKGTSFYEASNDEIKEIAFIVSRLVQIYTIRYDSEFSFNFYIYPGDNWYLRLIPRIKILGGFEVGTGVFVNTQDPRETLKFIKEHFDNPDFEKIKEVHQAEYTHSV